MTIHKSIAKTLDDIRDLTRKLRADLSDHAPTPADKETPLPFCESPTSTPTIEQPANQLYGWWSAQHDQDFPGSACVYATPDGRHVSVTTVNRSSTDPGPYKWPDAFCVGPVTKCVKMNERTMKDFTKKRF